MANHGCINGTLDDSKYSSLVPVIGVYIALATFVCLIFMVCDIFAGFRSRKPWVPCRLFSLNSVTLTLLAVVAKLPVDLTTPMPSAQDQLAKLTGTTLLCISIGFLMPSIGMTGGSEGLTNVIALSVLVITVAVNICMQIHTGVIFMFLSEHIIILCCMLTLLMVLWFLAFSIKGQNKINLDHNKELLKKGEESMLQRLKLCYWYGYNYNPQLVLCKNPKCATTGVLCILSMVVVIQAAFRSLVVKELKFCRGTSDYGLSIWMVIGTQILSITVGSFGTALRYVTMFSHFDWELIGQLGLPAKIEGVTPEHNNPLLVVDVRHFVLYVFLVPVMIWMLLLFIFVSVPFVIVPKALIDTCGNCWKDHSKNRVNLKFNDLFHGVMEVHVWTLRKSLEDMYRWLEVCKSEPLSHFLELLSLTPPSQYMYLQTIELRDPAFPVNIEVSFLSMVVLIETAAVAVPYTLTSSLIEAFKEVYEIIQYIDNRIRSVSFKNSAKSRLANEVWRNNRGFYILLPKIFESCSDDTIQSLSDFDRALLIIQGLKNALPSDLVGDEVGHITDYITRQHYSSIEDLYNHIEQMFVDMLHLYFVQLPTIIFNEVLESPAEEYDQRVKLALKFISKLESLEALVQWSFPVGSNISSLIARQVPATLTMDDVPGILSQLL